MVEGWTFLFSWLAGVLASFSFSFFGLAISFRMFSFNSVHKLVARFHYFLLSISISH